MTFRLYLNEKEKMKLETGYIAAFSIIILFLAIPFQAKRFHNMYGNGLHHDFWSGWVSGSGVGGSRIQTTLMTFGGVE